MRVAFFEHIDVETSYLIEVYLVKHAGITHLDFLSMTAKEYRFFVNKTNERLAREARAAGG